MITRREAAQRLDIPIEMATPCASASRWMGCSLRSEMDVGGMPQADVLRSIELLGTEVLPAVRRALG